MGALGLIALFMQGMFIFCAIIIIGVPSWCIGLWIKRNKRKKLLAAGEQIRPPSTLRRIIQNTVLTVMIAVWCTIAFLIVSHYAYPLFADKPLPYSENFQASKKMGALSHNEEPTFTEIDICPIDLKHLNSSDLAATCSSAAKYYYKELEHNIVRINISICPNKYTSFTWDRNNNLSYSSRVSRTLGTIDDYCLIAYCVYDSEPKNYWSAFYVANPGCNLQASINSLWIENEDKFENESKAEAESLIKKYIAEKLELPLEDVKAKKFTIKAVPSFLIPDIKAEAPENIK